MEPQEAHSASAVAPRAVAPHPEHAGIGAGSARRRQVLARSAGLSALLFAGCGPAGSSGAGGDAPRPAGKVIELRTHARGGAEKDGYQKNVDAFNEKFAGKYHVTYEGIPGNLYEGQETHMAGGTIGDIHYAHQSNIKMQEYAVRGAAVALDPFIAKDKSFKLGDWPQRAQDAMKVIDNKVFALPVRGQVAWLFLYWNRDMLKKAAVPEPTPNWTLDDLVENAKKLQQANSATADFHAVGYSWGSFETAVANVRRFNGEFFNPANGGGTKCTLDSAPCVQAIKWFYDHIKSGLFGPRSNFGSKQFSEGKMGFYFGRLAGERGGVANGVQQNFEWTFDIVPKGPTGRRGGFLSIDTQQINSASKNRDAAWELLKWLTNRQSGINLALQPDGSLTPGFRKDVYCSEQLLSDARFPKTAMKANCDNIDQPEGYTYPHNFRLTQPGAIQEVLNKYLNDIADLKLEPNPSIMKQVTSEIQTILDMPRL